MRTLALALTFAAIVSTAAAQGSKPADPYIHFKWNAAAAVAAERAREKLDLCRNPRSATGQVACPTDEFDRSNKNYLQLARAVGGLLRIYAHDHTDTGAEAIGKDYDAAQSAWAKYRDAECETVSEDLHSGMMNGHPWAYDEAACKLAVTRQHIYELDAVYSWLWTR